MTNLEREIDSRGWGEVLQEITDIAFSCIEKSSNRNLIEMYAKLEAELYIAKSTGNSIEEYRKSLIAANDGIILRSK
jgi:hypothetical protein